MERNEEVTPQEHMSYLLEMLALEVDTLNFCWDGSSQVFECHFNRDESDPRTQYCTFDPSAKINHFMPDEGCLPGEWSQEMVMEFLKWIEHTMEKHITKLQTEISYIQVIRQNHMTPESEAPLVVLGQGSFSRAIR
tara:strand:- start:1058 stop:1465 length:408 start_codon:yes stop_codon:yes gene_type:complete